MKILGYSHDKNKKCFYTDNHEDDEIIPYRMKFVKRYLFQYEPYMLRWVQVSVEELKDKLAEKTSIFTVESDNRENKKMRRNYLMRQ
mgnify:CR=1 FL=1